MRRKNLWSQRQQCFFSFFLFESPLILHMLMLVIPNTGIRLTGNAEVS